MISDTQLEMRILAKNLEETAKAFTKLRDGVKVAWSLFENSGVMREPYGSTGDNNLDKLGSMLDDMSGWELPAPETTSPERNTDYLRGLQSRSESWQYLRSIEPDGPYAAYTVGQHLESPPKETIVGTVIQSLVKGAGMALIHQAGKAVAHAVGVPEPLPALVATSVPTTQAVGQVGVAASVFEFVSHQLHKDLPK